MDEGPRLEYELIVRQQPKAARMCGLGKADRRPIDPPPIVQLRVSEYPKNAAPGDAPTPTTSFLQNPYYFMFASLAAPDSDDELHVLKDGRTRCTTGSVVSSLYHLKDTENGGVDAGFFVFPDLSVRTEGSYRLKLSLFEVKGTKVHHCKSIFSNPFYVYTAKKFPGMEESTPLSCSLADQGIKIRIRKDIRVRKKSLPFPAPENSVEGNDSQDGDAPSTSSTVQATEELPAEDSRPNNKRRALDSGKPESIKGKGKAARPAKRPRLVNPDPSQEKESEPPLSQPWTSYPPSGASFESTYHSAPTSSAGPSNSTAECTAPDVPPTAVSHPAHGQQATELANPPSASHPPVTWEEPRPPTVTPQLEAAPPADPASRRAHRPQDDYYRPSPSTSHSGALVSSIGLPEPRPTPPQPQPYPHPSSHLPLNRPTPREMYGIAHPPHHPSTAGPFSHSQDLASHPSPLPRTGAYPSSSSINYNPYSTAYYNPVHSLDPGSTTYTPYATSGYSTTEYRQPDPLARNERLTIPPQESTREIILPPSSNSAYNSYVISPPTPSYGVATSAASYPYVSEPRQESAALPMSPHHSATGTLNYPSQTSYATRPEQTWSTTSPHPLQPSQGPLGYAYRPPHDVDTFQYPGSTIPRADDARSALHLGPYDVPQDTPDKRPISSEEASPAASPRGRNLTLPPLRAGPTPAAPFASHVQSPTESHYVPPDVSAVQYYTTQNHPQIQHSPQLPPQAAVNYRYAHQVMEAGYYPSNVHPPQHPAYGRRVGDVASNTSSSGSTSVTPRTPIILPPPNHEMTPNGGKKNPLSIGHIVSDRA